MCGWQCLSICICVCLLCGCDFLSGCVTLWVWFCGCVCNETILMARLWLLSQGGKSQPAARCIHTNDEKATRFLEFWELFGMDPMKTWKVCSFSDWPLCSCWLWSGERWSWPATSSPASTLLRCSSSIMPCRGCCMLLRPRFDIMTAEGGGCRPLACNEGIRVGHFQVTNQLHHRLAPLEGPLLTNWHPERPSLYWLLWRNRLTPTMAHWLDWSSRGAQISPSPGPRIPIWGAMWGAAEELHNLDGVGRRLRY